MGIPSYFASLVKKHPKIRSRSCSGFIDWLWIDFNCIVYHCLKGLGNTQLPLYYGEERKEEWENLLIQSSIKYCEMLVRRAEPKKGVYIAIDGVVPMAKMKQQRLRRFKSGNARSKDTVLSWDKNAITPGTRFMERLQKAVQNMVQEHRGWSASSSHEYGEGEHKIMDQWRKNIYEGSYGLYGLDADLIVLSLLNRGNHPVWLFREEIKSREVTDDFCWFDIAKLSEILFENSKRKINDYCFSMSFLGNDFVPNSMSMSIREGGYEELMRIIKAMWEKEKYIIAKDGITISVPILEEIVNEFVKKEDQGILDFIESKEKFSKQSRKEEDEEWNFCGMAENILVSGNHVLYKNWREIYMNRWIGFYSKENINYISSMYVKAMKWAWLYYHGKTDDICHNWFYPWNLPPSWKHLSEYIKGNKEKLFTEKDDIVIHKGEIKEEEQLATVLPSRSWDLITNPKYKNLPSTTPWFFPQTFDVFIVGKKWMWETIARIPVMSVTELRRIIS